MYILVFIFGMLMGCLIVLAICAAILDDDIQQLEQAELDEITVMDAKLEDMFKEEVKRNNVDA